MHSNYCSHIHLYTHTLKDMRQFNVLGMKKGWIIVLYNCLLPDDGSDGTKHVAVCVLKHTVILKKDVNLQVYIVTSWCVW